MDCRLEPSADGKLRCTVCGWIARRPARRNCPGSTEPVEEFAEAGPCQFRGEIVRRAECQVCGQRGQIADVYACNNKEAAPLGECTLRGRGLRGVTNCLLCGEWRDSEQS